MRRLSYLFVLVLAAMLALPATVGAAGRTPADPSIMQPALNPAFTWTCWRSVPLGRATRCTCTSVPGDLTRQPSANRLTVAFRRSATSPPQQGARKST